MPAATVEIVKATPVHVKSSVGGPMPSFKSDVATGSPTASPAAVPAKPVSPSAPGKPVAAAPPVPPPLETKPADTKKPSAKEDMFNRMRQKANQQQEPEPETKPPVEEAPPTEETEAVEETPPGEETKPAETTPEANGKKAKVNPWKLVDEWKSKYSEVEKQLLETKKLIPDEASRKTEVERLTQAEKRAQELEKEITYTNYSKSQEFKEKYWDPYEKSYNEAYTELSELEVVGPDGESRKVTPGDFNDILFAPTLIKAKAIATERFGDYADDVMGLRKEVRRLHDLQANALKQAREEGVTREKEMVRQYEETAKKLQSEAKETWEKATQSILQDPEEGAYFRPVEGDDERNAALQKGYELFDQANSQNPLDPNKTPEERASLIKKHAAARARSAGYVALKHDLKALQAKYNEAMEKLKQYEASTPPTEAGHRTVTGSQPVKAMDRAIARLRAMAK